MIEIWRPAASEQNVSNLLPKQPRFSPVSVVKTTNWRFHQDSKVLVALTESSRTKANENAAEVDQQPSQLGQTRGFVPDLPLQASLQKLRRSWSHQLHMLDPESLDVFCLDFVVSATSGRESRRQETIADIRVEETKIAIRISGKTVHVNQLASFQLMHDLFQFEITLHSSCYFVSLSDVASHGAGATTSALLRILLC